MNFTKQERRNTYLELAEMCTGYDEVFICNAIKDVLHLSNNRINENDFPELFLFKEQNTPAWLSNQIEQTGIEFYYPTSIPTYNFIKSIVMLLCAEMCKTEDFG